MIRSLITLLGKILLRGARPADAAPFRELRLGALQDSLIAFTADHQKNQSQPLKYWEDMLTTQPDESTISLDLDRPSGQVHTARRFGCYLHG